MHLSNERTLSGKSNILIEKSTFEAVTVKPNRGSLIENILMHWDMFQKHSNRIKEKLGKEGKEHRNLNIQRKKIQA